VARILGWLLDRQGRPGAYGEGCDKTRHAQRICQHCLGGFFSPAPAEQRLTPITLPNGKVFRAEPAARWSDWTGFFAPDVIVAGLRALALGGPAYRPELSDVMEAVVAHQELEWSVAQRGPVRHARGPHGDRRSDGLRALRWTETAL
jgi:hypothetical protein